MAEKKIVQTLTHLPAQEPPCPKMDEGVGGPALSSAGPAHFWHKCNRCDGLFSARGVEKETPDPEPEPEKPAEEEAPQEEPAKSEGEVSEPAQDAPPAMKISTPPPLSKGEAVALPSGEGPYSPLFNQYIGIKKQFPDAIILFRLGDFYETFNGDAEIISRELDIVLTSRNISKTKRIPMAGIPFHSREQYITQLIAKGYHVAVAEQTSEEAINGLHIREVVKVVTPISETNIQKPAKAKKPKTPQVGWKDGKPAPIEPAKPKKGKKTSGNRGLLLAYEMRQRLNDWLDSGGRSCQQKHRELLRKVELSGLTGFKMPAMLAVTA